MVIALRDLGVGAGHTHSGNLCLCEGVGSRDGNAGTVRAQNDGHVLGDQIAGCGHGLVVGGLVIHHFQLDIVSLPANVYCGGFCICILHTQNLLLTAGTVVAGEGLEDADHHGITVGRRIGVAAAAGFVGRLCRRAAGTQCQRHAAGQQKCKNLLHFFTSLNLSACPPTVDVCTFLTLFL